MDSCRQQFLVEFQGEEPDFCCRIPGRVNLIGEHIDYCGYAVCPMAIQRSILVAAKVTDFDPFIHIVNSNKNSYQSIRVHCQDFRISDCDKSEQQYWAKYFLCGVKEILKSSTSAQSDLKGMKVLVSGDIPPCAGLSSSSALVCAGTFIASLAHKVKLSKMDLAVISAKAERCIGTQGGGMDQAIIFLAKEGCASYIRFNPLSNEDVKLPKGGVFVIAQSMVEKHKATSPEFNIRVMECRLSCLLLCKRFNIVRGGITVLKDVQYELNYSLEEMVKLVQKELHETPYTKTEICKILKAKPSYLDEKILSENTRNVQFFKLYQRSLHVLQEALRVEEFCNLCSDTKNEDEECLIKLGDVMNRSHKSLKELYECSHPQLDKLVSLCLDLGAYGARLTGAGWGGCVVALVSQSKVDHFVTLLKEQFYRKLINYKGELDGLVFHAEAFEGASVHTYTH